MLRRLQAIGAVLRAAFDLRDVVAFVGLALLAAGLGQVWVPLALIVPGAIIIFVALRGQGGAE